VRRDLPIRHGRDDEHLGLPSHDGLARTPDGTALMARRLKLEHRLQHRVSAKDGSGRSSNPPAAVALATVLRAVDANGAVMAFRQFLRRDDKHQLADFRGGQNARLQSLFSFTSGPEEQFGSP